MIYRFKLYGQRYGIDTKSLTVHPLSELQYDMLRYLKLPFEDSFPSSLRYDLAKYESSLLTAAYAGMKKMCEDGVFLSDVPATVPDAPYPVTVPEKEFVFGEKKLVFATEVIRASDEGAKVVSAVEDATSPVKETDYDLICSEYERIAKEIIKRKTGRLPSEVFGFAPFAFPFVKDEKGYLHIADSSLTACLESDAESLVRKRLECGIAIL